MVDRQSVGDWPDQELVDDAMCRSGDTIQLDSAIAIPIMRCGPYPAIAGGVNLREETVDQFHVTVTFTIPAEGDASRENAPR